MSTIIRGASAQPIGNIDVSYRQDNLIAGNLQMVTQNVTLKAGQGVLNRGTVLGKDTTGEYLVCKATATDGSQIPSAVLSDTYDATDGEVSGAGVYLTGEFNANRIVIDDSWTLDALRDAARINTLFFKDVIITSDIS